MSCWSRLLKREVPRPPYGLHPDTPVLCVGGVPGEIDYLQRIRCPSGMPVEFQWQGSIARTKTEYLNRPDVALCVSPGTRRLVSEASPDELPLDAYLIACECGQHGRQVMMDMYFRGPELPIEAKGWTLAEGISPSEDIAETAACPYCGKDLRTPRAEQCRHCKMDWHAPDNVHRGDSQT